MKGIRFGSVEGKVRSYGGWGEEVKMVGRPVAVPDRQGVSDRLGDVVLRRFDRPAQRFPMREVGGDRRRIGAAGSVGVLRLDEFPLQYRGGFSVEEEIAAPLLQEVAPLHEDGAAAEGEDLPGGLLGLAEVPDLHSGKQLGFMDIGGDQ